MKIETKTKYRFDKKRIESILESWIRNNESDYSAIDSIEWSDDMEITIQTIDNIDEG